MSDINELIKKAQNELLCTLARANSRMIPAAVSNRHMHVNREDIERLFGRDCKLTELKPLSQPGQFACNEVVEIRGNRGSIKNVRVLGPARSETQVEISVTDSFVLGIAPMIRMSADLSGTPGCTLIGPAGSVELSHGVIVSMRHLHMSKEQAAAYGLKDGDKVCARGSGDRAVILQNISVRCGDGHELELHIDTDEANAAVIKNGDYLEIV